MDTTSSTILIIEDDAGIVSSIRVYLSELGYRIESTDSGAAGIAIVSERPISLIILDLGLPDMSGMEVCRELRRRQVFTPILMLTSRSGDTDKFLGFETGADDYVTKPFSMLELLGRVKALLRRANGEFSLQTASDPEMISAGTIQLDRRSRNAQMNGELIELTAIEFDLLWLLMSNPTTVFSREELLKLVWGYNSLGYDGTVPTHISRLRAKIEPDTENPTFIKTVWGKGYKFEQPQ